MSTQLQKRYGLITAMAMVVGIVIGRRLTGRPGIVVA